MRVAAFAITLSLALPGCPAKHEGCKKDTDCKADRICVKGRCKAPPSTDPRPADPRATRPRPGPGPLSRAAPGGAPPPPPPPAGAGSPALPAIPLPPPGQLRSLKICVDGKCVDLTGSGAKGPGVFFDLMDLFSQVFMGGLLGAGSSWPFTPHGTTGKGGKKKPKIELCANGNCVKLDAGLVKRPEDIRKLIDLFQNILGGRLQAMVPPLWRFKGKGRFRKHPGFPQGSPFGSGGSAGKDPAGRITFRSVKAIRDAGPDAVGKVAELKGLGIVRVRDDEVVLQGKGKLLVVLSVPPHLKELTLRLRTRTSRITARFHVVQPVSGDLIKGELLAVRGR